MCIFNIKLALQISLLLQATLLAFDVDDYDDDDIENEIKEFRIKLKETFGYVFNLVVPMDVLWWNSIAENWFGLETDDSYKFDDILVWKITEDQQTFRPEDYSNGFTEFGSKETFLIFTKVHTTLHSCLPPQRQYTVYYWAGIHTTLEEKKRVAKYAAMFFAWMFNYLSTSRDLVNFTREDQVFESESFIFTLNYLRSTPQLEDGRHRIYVNESFPLNGPNVYIVKENHTRSIVKVPIGLGPWLITSNTCLVVEIPQYIEELYPVTTFCGGSASDSTRRRAISLAHNIHHVTDRNDPFQIIHRVNRKFKALLELLEDGKYYRPTETKYLEDANTLIRVQDNGVSFFKIVMTNVDGKLMLTRVEITERPLAFDNYDQNDNYILDSKSVAGLFFVYGNNINMDQLVWSIQYAEEYLHYKTKSLARPIRMRISCIDWTQHYIDFGINEESQEDHDEIMM